MIYFTSDWHFNHNRPFIWADRGFNSVQEMNERIIENHNKIVKPNDIVYCLGDCCLGDSIEENKKLIERLNGTLYLIRGNHCTEARNQMYTSCKNVIDCGRYAFVLKDKKWNFYLSHYPTAIGNYDDEKIHNKFYCLCGHSHTTDKWKDFNSMKSYHVELDAHNIFPVSLEEIKADIRTKY